MAKHGWARITDSVADILRRGAWYRVVEASDDGHVLIDVRKGVQVRLSASDVILRDEVPDAWSVVVRTGVLRPTLGKEKGRDVITTYGVCPQCHERQEFDGKPTRLRCT